VARVAVARAGEVQELIPCTQREGMCCRALLEGACVDWHPECLFYTVYSRVAGRMDRRLLKGDWEESCRALQEDKIRFRGHYSKTSFAAGERGRSVMD